MWRRVRIVRVRVYFRFISVIAGMICVMRRKVTRDYRDVTTHTRARREEREVS